MFKILIVIAFISIACKQVNINKNRIIDIGKSLIKIDSTNYKKPVIKDIVFVGDELVDRILTIKPYTKRYSFDIINGDLKEIDYDKSADCLLRISTDYKTIAIRLKYNKEKDKYDILGWLTL